MRSKIFKRAIHLLLALPLAACSGGPAASAGGLARSSLPREAAPQAPAEDRQALAKGSTAFALDLYQSVNTGGENLFFSPYSILIALGMAYAGAQGETAAQMAEVLHFSLPPDRLHPSINALDQELATRKDVPGAKGKDGKGFRLNIVNDFWGQKDYAFLQEYLDLLAKNYGSGMRLVDFAKDPDGSRQAINQYIAEQTEQRIKDLIGPGEIDPATRLVLTNAIYFNAAWMHPFDSRLTETQDFSLLDGSSVPAQMMSMPAVVSLRYLAGPGFQAVGLPYDNPDLSMFLIVPDAGNFEAFESGLDADALEAILAQMREEQVRLRMPKFTFESQLYLSGNLAAMGMVDAFSPESADFSGITGDRSLYIDEVIHKAFVGVDEAGTEAAAATAVVMRAAGLAEEPVELTVDRPFIFLIYDLPTRTVLFFGRVIKP